MKNLECEILNSDRKSQIIAVRKSSFLSSHPSIDLSGLEWNKTDENSLHIGLSSNGKLLSCLRLSIFQNKTTLERSTLIETPDPVHFPSLLLSRGATLPEYEGQRLHSLLRARALEMAVHFNVQSVLGSLEEKSTRLENLLKAGYEILSRKDSWKGSFLQSKGPVVLIGLTSPEKIEKAHKVFQNKYHLPPLISVPELKIVS